MKEEKEREKRNSSDLIRSYIECVESGKDAGLSGYDLMIYVGKCIVEKAETIKKLEEAAIKEAEAGGGGEEQE